MLLALTWGNPALTSEEVPRVTSISVDRVGDGVRIRLEGTGDLAPEPFLLDDPYRLVVDLRAVEFGLPVSPVPDGWITQSIRFGTYLANRGRFVFELTRPAVVTAMDQRVQAGKYRVEFVLSARSREDFLGDAMHREAAYAQAGQRVLEVLKRAQPENFFEGPVHIIIDPGHGGEDPGAVGPSGIVEKDIVLRFSRELAAWLRPHPKFVVHMTRDRDAFVSLVRRLDLAAEVHASLLVSIHADNFHLPEARGFSVYALMRDSDYDTLPGDHSWAHGDRHHHEKGGPPASAIDDLVTDQDLGIVVALMKEETHAFSLLLAERVLQALKPLGNLARRPLRLGRYQVLSAPDIPSILVELGYMSNADDFANLVDESWHREVAKRMAEAIVGHFAVQRGWNGSGNMNDSLSRQTEGADANSSRFSPLPGAH